jgi:hypothetical protein
MKTKTYIILGLGLILLLGQSYAQDETKAANTTTTPDNETTTQPITTTTTATTTTSLETTTTTSSAETTTTKSTSTTKPQPKTTTKKKTCNTYCKNIGYEGGDCRLNILECRVRNEVKSIYGGKLCPTARLDTCCCQTDKSVDMDSKYSYTLNTPIEPLQDNTIQKNIKENLQNLNTATTKEESLTAFEEYAEEDGGITQG